jgi:hypothetical protein
VNEEFDMDWQTVREKYPHCWMVMEVPDAYVETDQLIVNELEIVKDFGDAGSDAMKYTSKLLRDNRRRHFILYHTANQTIYIKVVLGSGLRYLLGEDD